MSEHTPGPWRVPKHAWFQVVPHNGLPGHAVIAMVYECAHSRRDRDEATANAHLIAAAPELLAACKIAEEAVRTAIPQEAVQLIHEQGDFEALCIARIRLEEAISAAERS